MYCGSARLCSRWYVFELSLYQNAPLKFNLENSIDDLLELFSMSQARAHEVQKLLLSWRERWLIYFATSTSANGDLEDLQTLLNSFLRRLVACTLASWLP
jgi:hypothetical protein